MKNFIENYTGVVCAIVFIIVFVGGSFLFKFFIDKEIERDKYHSYTRYEIYTEMNQLTYDSIKSVLVEQVNSYIQQSAPTSTLDGLVVVNKCIEA